MRDVRHHFVAVLVWIGAAWASPATGLLADDVPGPKGPKFVSKLLDDRHKIRYVSGPDGVRFEITGGGRGGKAEITLTEGVWPADLTIRVHETFFPDFTMEADNGSVKLFGKLARDRTQSDEKQSVWTNPSVCWFDAKGQGLDKLSSRVKYVMTVTHTEEKGRVMEVVLPPHFCDKNVKVLRLHWINALE